MPLVVMLPVSAHAALALLAGSNLWPLLLIFTAPIACLYLALLFATHIVRRDFAGG